MERVDGREGKEDGRIQKIRELVVKSFHKTFEMDHAIYFSYFSSEANLARAE